MGVVRTVVPAVVLACLLGVPAPAVAETVSCPNADRPVSASTRGAARLAVACLVDRERASRGLPRLAWEKRVAAAAQGHAEDMVARNYFAHTAPPPKPATSAERLRAQGYEPAFEGEVLGQGQPTPREIVGDWLRSASHCRMLLVTAGPDWPSIGPSHVGVGTAGTGGALRWSLLVALPAGAQDAGYPGFTPACPVAGPAADRASVKPFVRRPQNGEPTSGAPAAAGGATSPVGGPSLTRPVLASTSGLLFSGDRPELVVEAAPDAVLRVSVTNFRGQRRDVGLAERIDGAQGARPGAAVFALPPVRIFSAVEVAVTDGRTTVARRLVPTAVIRALRARHTVRGVRVTGRLAPALAGRRIRVTLVRGGRTARRMVRTLRGGRFAAVLRPPAGAGRVAVRVVAPGDDEPYRQAAASVRS